MATPTAPARLSVFGVSFGLGLTAALYLFLWTIIVMYYPEAGGRILQGFEGYFAYTVSWPGAFIAAVYGFLDGAIFGALVSLFYNLFSGAK